jgi:hypothetical protein
MWRVVILAGIFGMAVDIAAAHEDNSSPNSSSSHGADTSVLHSFEKSVQSAPENNRQNNPQTASSPRREHDDGVGYELGEEIIEGLLDVTMTILAEGGRSTLRRLDPAMDATLQRTDGDPSIPFVRYDFGYQRVSANIDAHINRLEGGYGPVALFLEDYSFNETSPASTLKIQRHMLLYRMSGKRAEIDMGLGESVISGMRRTTVGAVSLRGRFMLGENVSMEIMPVWGGGMSDYELALQWGRQYGSLKIGYRTLHSLDASLSGPFAGFALYF